METAERLLLRGQDRIALTPKAFDTLLVLLQSSGRLVRKDDLIRQVWPDAIVEEANLARNVWTLRKALGEGNGEHTYIETIPKIGYRFMAPVTVRLVETAHTGMDDRVAVAPRGFRKLAPATLLVLCVATVGAVAFWRHRTPSPTIVPSIVFLTDGTHDDLGASWTNNGRIYFSRAVTDRRVETWTMNADGTDQHRANTEITSLLSGRWSPDGKKVIVVKDDDPRTVYLADADGTHEIVLPFVPGNLDWSPDESRFVYQTRTSSGASAISVYELATAKSTQLATTPEGDADPSFSPDGTQIAFTSWRDGNAEIYVMQSDGSNVRRVTNHPAFDNYPVFSPDGTHLAFQSNREDEHVEIYLQNIDADAPPTRLTRSATLTGLVPKCWTPDGSRMLVYTNSNGRDQIGLIGVDPYPARLLLADAAADLSFERVSADGRQMLYEARLADRSIELRVTDLETMRTRRVFRTDPDYPLDFHLAASWSPDDAVIAFSARADGNSEIFSIKADGTLLRNLTQNPLLDSSPVFSVNGHEIVFARDEFGRAQLYRMDTDGGGQRRVTDRPGYEMSPAASPDGRHLAFSGDRESRGLEILLLDLTTPRTETLLAARRSHDTLPAFSPDGTHIVFVSRSEGSPEIFRMKADGTGLVRVTHSKDEKTSPQFMKDPRHIVFSSKRDGKLALYQVGIR